MRMIFSLVGLLIVLAIVGVLAKKQLSAVVTLPTVTSTTATPANSANVSEQSKQIQTQVKEQLNEAMKATVEAQQKVLDGENADKPADKTGSAY